MQVNKKIIQHENLRMLKEINRQKNVNTILPTPLSRIVLNKICKKIKNLIIFKKTTLVKMSNFQRINFKIKMTKKHQQHKKKNPFKE